MSMKGLTVAEALILGILFGMAFLWCCEHCKADVRNSEISRHHLSGQCITRLKFIIRTVY